MQLPCDTFREIASTLCAYRLSTEDRLHRPIDIVGPNTSETYLLNMLKGLLIINYLTFDIAYPKVRQFQYEDLKTYADKVLDKSAVRGTRPVNIYRMLVLCERVLYNCNPNVPNVDADKHLMFLNGIVASLRYHIISHIPEYKEEALRW